MRIFFVYYLAQFSGSILAISFFTMYVHAAGIIDVVALDTTGQLALVEVLTPPTTMLGLLCGLIATYS